MGTSLSILLKTHCLKHLDTTGYDISDVGAITSKHAIDTIPKGDTLIFVVDNASWTTPYAPAKGLVARADLCWVPTEA